MVSKWAKVIVGFDARDESHDALRLGRELADAEGADLHVAVVHPRGQLPFEEALVREPISYQLDETLYEEVAHQLQGAPFIPARLHGGLSGRSAARALYEYAESEAADLIVVGSSHRGKIGRVLPGSVGESLLRGAPCIVAVAPRGFARGEHAGFGLIGVGYDGSPESRHALLEAEALVRVLDCKLRVITVVPELAPLTVQAADLGRIQESMRRGYRNSLEKAVATVGKGIAVEPVLIDGDPAALLADQGVELDLIVIGSRGYGPVRATLAGAISAAVMRTAPCPVLVTPRASES